MSQPPDPAPLSPANAAPTPPAQKPPRLALLIASGFGLGYLPNAPGTWGSIGGVFLFAMMYRYPLERLFEPHSESFPLAPFVPLLFVAVIGVWSAARVSTGTGIKDPAIVVIDEVSGQQITMVPVTLLHWHPNMFLFFELDYQVSWKYLLAGLILFRVFDIWKPWPVRAAEKLPGGWGIMADDWVAGIYAALCLWGLRAAGL